MSNDHIDALRRTAAELIDLGHRLTKEVTGLRMGQYPVPDYMVQFSEGENKLTHSQLLRLFGQEHPAFNPVKAVSEALRECSLELVQMTWTSGRDQEAEYTITARRP